MVLKAKLILALLLLLALMNTSTYGVNTSGSIKVHFSPFDGVKDLITSELTKANESLEIAIYSFYDNDLWETVKKLSLDGVKVKLILEKKAFYPSLKNCERCIDLEDAGVDIRYVTPTLHHKFAIIDGNSAENKTLLTGSGNWSKSSYLYYDEDFLIIKNADKYIVPFQKEFNLLWENSKEWGISQDFETFKPGNSSNSAAFFTSANFETYQSRSGEPGFRKKVKDPQKGAVGSILVRAIDNAKSEIKIATAHFRRFDIFNALKRAHKRGVKVEMILDAQEFSYKYKCPPKYPTHLEECLNKLGSDFDVRYKMYSHHFDFKRADQMHSKYMIVDGKKVYTGSFNWSSTAELKNFENLLYLNEAQAGSYLENFSTIFNYGKGKFSDLIKEIKQQDGMGPCYFPPISLSVYNIRKVKRAYSYAACKD